MDNFDINSIVSNKCYEIFFDMDCVQDLNLFFNDISKVGDIIFFEKQMIIWLKDDMSQKNIENVFKKNKIKQFFISKYDVDVINMEESIIKTWLYERCTGLFVKYCEEKNQEKLRKMMNNIKNVENILKNYE